MRNLILLSSLITAFGLQANSDSANNPTTLVGSTLQLNTLIELAPNKTDAYFQYGKQIKEAKVDEYYPNCNIELYSISVKSRKIKPDTFSISQVIEDEVYPFSGETAQPVETIFQLSSVNQPDVIKLTCSQWGNEISNDDLTITEIKEALGEKFSFN